MPPAREECGDEATDNEEDRAGDGHMGGVWEGMTTAERLVEIYRNPAAKKVAQEVGLWVVVFGFSKGVFGKV